MRTVGFLSIGRHVDLILNRMRCEQALLNLSEEAAPREQRELSKRASEKDRSAVIGAGLSIQNEGPEKLNPKHRCEYPLRNAHSDDRPDNPVDPRTNANGVGAEKEKTEDQREYVEARLKQISEWERKISGFNKRRVK